MAVDIVSLVASLVVVVVGSVPLSPLHGCTLLCAELVEGVVSSVVVSDAGMVSTVAVHVGVLLHSEPVDDVVVVVVVVMVVVMVVVGVVVAVSH
mmetsp:Transcript_34324/g.106568  ORF Transcript_34324/g.106568 Transcript_34324/m.106568 type:complete len:94 (+) Transcript_34324:1364-1645(+)